MCYGKNSPKSISMLQLLIFFKVNCFIYILYKHLLTNFKKHIFLIVHYNLSKKNYSWVILIRRKKSN